MTSTTGRSELARYSLGVPGVVFLVLAAVAPLAGIVVVAALGIALGNGAGMVAAFIAVIIVLLLLLHIALADGHVLAVYLRSRRPDIYAGLESDIERLTEPAVFGDPAGMVDA